jgi:hypothetical protein
VIDPEELGSARLGEFIVGWHRADDSLVILVLGTVGGAPRIIEVHVEPFPEDLDAPGIGRQIIERFGNLAEKEVPDAGLTAGALRQLPLGAMVADHLERQRRADEVSESHPGAPIVIGSFGAEGSVGLRSVSELTPLLDAHTAAAYVELAQSGHPNVLLELSDRFGISVSGIRARLARARREGLLTPARRGVASGELTDKGREVLRRSAPVKGGGDG